MILYRIVTEKKNLKQLTKLISNHFRGFTLIESRGYWDGKPEPSLIIEIALDKKEMSPIDSLVNDIKYLNKQQAVLVQVLDIPFYLK